MRLDLRTSQPILTYRKLVPSVHLPAVSRRPQAADSQLFCVSCPAAASRRPPDVFVYCFSSMSPMFRPVFAFYEIWAFSFLMISAFRRHYHQCAKSWPLRLWRLQTKIIIKNNLQKNSIKPENSPNKRRLISDSKRIKSASSRRMYLSTSSYVDDARSTLLSDCCRASANNVLIDSYLHKKTC